MKVKNFLLIAIIALSSIPILVVVGLGISSNNEVSEAEKANRETEDKAILHSKDVSAKLLEHNNNLQIHYDTICTYDTLICRLAAYQFVYDTIVWSKKDNGVYICKKFTVIIDSTLNSADVKCNLIASNATGCIKITGDGNTIDCYLAYKRKPDETYQNGFIFDFDSDTVWMVLKLTKFTISHS